MTEIKPFLWYEGTVKFRRERNGKPWPVKPECEPCQGKRITVQAAWIIEDGDTRYPGEWAMTTYDYPDTPITWIASGDLVDLVETTKPRPYLPKSQE